MATNIGVAKGNPKAGGYVFRAPIGTVLPTSPTDNLNEAFSEIALISSDGVVFSRSETDNDFRDWAGRIVYSESTERKETAKITYIESIPSVLEEYNGNATGNESSFYTDHDGEHPEYVYVIDSIIGDDLLCRTVCPRGKVTSVDDKTHAEGNLLGYPCNYTFLYDDAAGFTVRDYYAKVTPGGGE